MDPPEGGNAPPAVSNKKRPRLEPEGSYYHNQDSDKSESAEACGQERHNQKKGGTTHHQTTAPTFTSCSLLPQKRIRGTSQHDTTTPPLPDSILSLAASDPNNLLAANNNNEVKKRSYDANVAPEGKVNRQTTLTKQEYSLGHDKDPEVGLASVGAAAAIVAEETTKEIELEKKPAAIPSPSCTCDVTTATTIGAQNTTGMAMMSTDPRSITVHHKTKNPHRKMDLLLTSDSESSEEEDESRTASGLTAGTSEEFRYDRFRSARKGGQWHSKHTHNQPKPSHYEGRIEALKEQVEALNAKLDTKEQDLEVLEDNLAYEQDAREDEQDEYWKMLLEQQAEHKVEQEELWDALQEQALEMLHLEGLLLEKDAYVKNLMHVEAAKCKETKDAVALSASHRHDLNSKPSADKSAEPCALTENATLRPTEARKMISEMERLKTLNANLILKLQSQQQEHETQMAAKEQAHKRLLAQKQDVERIGQLQEQKLQQKDFEIKQLLSINSELRQVKNTSGQKQISLLKSELKSLQLRHGNLQQSTDCQQAKTVQQDIQFLSVRGFNAYANLGDSWNQWNQEMSEIVLKASKDFGLKEHFSVDCVPNCRFYCDNTNACKLWQDEFTNWMNRLDNDPQSRSAQPLLSSKEKQHVFHLLCQLTKKGFMVSPEYWMCNTPLMPPSGKHLLQCKVEDLEWMREQALLWNGIMRFEFCGYIPMALSAFIGFLKHIFHPSQLQGNGIPPQSAEANAQGNKI